MEAAISLDGKQKQDDNEIEMGYPIQVVLAHPDHSFELDENALAKILLQDDIKDRNVVVISVAGAFRKGKSFLLNFFLRYLNSKYLKKEETDNWLGGENDPLKGFPWQSSDLRITTGIWLWSKAFQAKTMEGKKVAILLMDTQGVFDNKSSTSDCSTIFALSTMLSSVQIYNLSENIHDYDLLYLKLFTDYGRLVLDKSDNTPFQNLIFLVRNWSHSSYADFGANGGEKVLNSCLQISNTQDSVSQSIRKHIQFCFSNLSCFLMPHPGEKVSYDTKFDGKLSDIHNEFKKQLKTLILMLLEPQNLVIKKINGKLVKAKNLFDFFKIYFQQFQSSELLKPECIFKAAEESYYSSLVKEAMDIYKKQMNGFYEGATLLFLTSARFQSQHDRCVRMSVERFQRKNKIVEGEISQIYFEKLQKEMDEAFLNFKANFELKKEKIFKSYKIPIMAIITLVITTFARIIFNTISFNYVVMLCEIVIVISVFIIIAWIYNKLKPIVDIFDDYTAL